MADNDLEAIRQARLQQLREQAPQKQGKGSGDDAERQKDAAAAARDSILSQILSRDASDRLGRIRLVNEARATDVEDRLIMLARSGQLRQQQVTEAVLIDILNSMNKQEAKQAPQVVTRRRGWDDDENDEDLLFDL